MAEEDKSEASKTPDFPAVVRPRTYEELNKIKIDKQPKGSKIALPEPITEDPEKRLSLLGALAVAITNVKASPVVTPAIHPIASEDDLNSSVAKPIIPRAAITGPIDALLRYKVDGVNLHIEDSKRLEIADKVDRVQTYIEENRMTLFAPVAGTVIEIARPDGFQPELLPQAKGVYKAYSELAKTDKAITPENLSTPFGISMQYDVDSGGEFSSRTLTSSIKADTDKTKYSLQIDALTLVHENAHRQWNTNKRDHRFARMDTNGLSEPSVFIKTDIDKLTHYFADEAFAKTAEYSADMLAKIDEMKRLSIDRGSGQAELDRISSIQEDVDNHLIKYSDFKEKFKALREGGEPYSTARDQILKQEREALDAFVTNNKALPTDMRAKVFLDKLQNPSVFHVGYYIDGINSALKDDPAAYQRGGLTIPVEDIANLTRDVSTKDKIGLSPLEEYVKANPEFNFKKFIDNLPWAQAQAIPGTPEERKALHMEVAKVSDQYDPDAKSRLARAERSTEAALQKPDFDGAVAAFKKYYGFGGNNFGDGGGGGDSSAFDIADPALKQKVESIMDPAPKGVIKAIEEKLARTVAKEILTELIQPTIKSKPADHPYTPDNLVVTTNMADSSTKPQSSVEDIPQRIKELAQEFPDQQRPSSTVLKTVTDRTMRSVREAEIKAVQDLYKLADTSEKSEKLGFWMPHLKDTMGQLAATDRYFAKEIAAGTIPQANLGTIINNGKTSEEILSDLDKKDEALKAAEKATVEKLEDKTKKAPAPTAP